MVARVQVQVLAWVVVIGACSSPPAQPSFPSVCDQPSPPPECSTGCDPARGSQDCPTGFHCTADRRCDAECVVGTDDCGAGYSCTGDGHCLPDQPTGPDASCPSIHFEAKQTTPAIHLLIDRSTSMLDPIGTGSTTRFEAIRAALVAPTTGIVSALENQAYFGASLFTYLDTPCPELRSVGRAKQNRTAIANLIDTFGPMGSTPTGPAIETVIEHFFYAPPPPTSPRFIVLATDGLPNQCPGDSTDARMRAVAAAHAAFNANIRMFVLSMDTGIPTDHLQDLADAGAGYAGAPYYLATSPQQLTAAFDQIIGGVVSCELAIDGKVEASAASMGVVTLNGHVLDHGADWVLVNSSTIRLVGAACTALKSMPSATVDAEFPCDAVILL